MSFDGFNIVDGAVALVIIVSGILAYSRGFTREVLAILGWIAAAIAAFYFTPTVEPLLTEAPLIGPLLADSCTLARVATIAVVFAAALIVLSIFTPLFSAAIQDSPLGGVDRAAGFLFGVARGVLLVAVFYLVYDLVVPEDQRLAQIEEARSTSMVEEWAGLIRQEAEGGVPAWLSGPIEDLMGECGGGAAAPVSDTKA